MFSLNKSKTFEGRTPELHFLDSKQHQADGAIQLVHLWKIFFRDKFGFGESWAYELTMKLVKKYQKLGRIVKVEKVEYLCFGDVRCKDVQFWWDESLLPPKTEQVFS